MGTCPSPSTEVASHGLQPPWGVTPQGTISSGRQAGLLQAACQPCCLMPMGIGLASPWSSGPGPDGQAWGRSQRVAGSWVGGRPVRRGLLQGLGPPAGRGWSGRLCSWSALLPQLPGLNLSLTGFSFLTCRWPNSTVLEQSSPWVMGMLLQNPSWPQADRHARARRHLGSSAGSPRGWGGDWCPPPGPLHTVPAHGQAWEQEPPPEGASREAGSSNRCPRCCPESTAASEIHGRKSGTHQGLTPRPRVWPQDPAHRQQRPRRHCSRDLWRLKAELSPRRKSVRPASHTFPPPRGLSSERAQPAAANTHALALCGTGLTGPGRLRQSSASRVARTHALPFCGAGLGGPGHHGSRSQQLRQLLVSVFTCPGKCSLVKMIVITGSCTEHASPETLMCSHTEGITDPSPSPMGLWGMMSSTSHKRCRQVYPAARELPEAPTFCFTAGKQSRKLCRSGRDPGHHWGAQIRAGGGGQQEMAPGRRKAIKLSEKWRVCSESTGDTWPGYKWCTQWHCFFLLRSVFTICRYKQASSKHIQNKAFPTRDPRLQPQDGPLPNRAPHMAPTVTCPSSVGTWAQWSGVHTGLSHVHSPRTQTK